MTVETLPKRSASGLPATSRARIDQAVETLAGRKQRWAELDVEGRLHYLRELSKGTLHAAPGQVEAAAEAQGVPLESPLGGEQWLGGPYVTLRVLRLLTQSLEAIRDTGTVPVAPDEVRVRVDGQVAVQVFPADLIDRLLYSGFRAEVWMRHGVTPENLADHVAGAYRDPAPRGKVALVLSAGNVASIGPLDTVHKLFAEGHVVILKLNPVNDYLGPFIEDAFGALIRDGYVRVVYGGAEVGSYLVHHPEVDEVHITGSARTHDAIVFGPGAEGAARKARNAPLLDKRITSELGNVSPVVLLPGRWSDADLAFQAENVATQMTMNGGFNCNAAKVLITHRYWPQRQAFMDALRDVLRSLPPRLAYYPGAEERYETFLDSTPRAEVLGRRTSGVLPPALLPDVDPGRRDALAFTTESFCAVTAETALGGVGTEGFLAEAVSFCNERLYGTLNAELILHPKTERQLGGALEEAIAQLRYGSVAVNHWPALSYGLGTTTWGAYPGHTLDDIQSGIGIVHNTRMFDRPEKSVIWGPFRVFPKPPWFATHKTGHRVAERITRLEANPGLARLPGVVLAAILG